jgi:hypothetical protein
VLCCAVLQVDPAGGLTKIAEPVGVVAGESCYVQHASRCTSAMLHRTISMRHAASRSEHAHTSPGTDCVLLSFVSLASLTGKAGGGSCMQGGGGGVSMQPGRDEALHNPQGTMTPIGRGRLVSLLPPCHGVAPTARRLPFSLRSTGIAPTHQPHLPRYLLPLCSH